MVARIYDFLDVLPKLASPDTGKPLKQDGDKLTDGEYVYPIYDGKPILFPERLQKYYIDGKFNIPYSESTNPEYQYFLIAQIKMYGVDVNCAEDDYWYQTHMKRARQLLQNVKGDTLDIGCDDPIVSASLLPDGTGYIGLDPLSYRGNSFKIMGFGEFMPFADNSFDNVLFMTSLDHIFDWHTGFKHACRVLKPGGKMYLATLVWNDRVELVHDTVHFHHFQEHEIVSEMENAGLVIEDQVDYPWKGNDHRKGRYVIASKK